MSSDGKARGARRHRPGLTGLTTLTGLTLGLLGCAGSVPFEPPAEGPELAVLEPGESESAGRATTLDFGPRAFTQPVPGLAGAQRTGYLTGQALFELDWTVTGSAPSDRDGLGPTYNATSCQACHFANGRGAPPATSGGTLATALLRVSLPGQAPTGAPRPHPIYGDQIQPSAVPGVPIEGAVRIFYDEEPGTYDDGTPLSLLRPRVSFEPALGDPGPDLVQSVRVASSTIGLGLLEAIPDADILAHADPADADGDGIAGRPNYVYDTQARKQALGRFGWKANQPSLAQQNAAALIGDMGLTSPLFPVQNCPDTQPACRNAPEGGSPEVDAPRSQALLAFVRGTAVPARRSPGDPAVLRGKHLFHALRCAACHVPSFQTGDVPDFPLLSAQRIWPYTDLLLHDMGPHLADGREDFEASGRHFRTPPLWGLGLQERVSGHLRLLHDGRARGFAEAILWHDGEAAAAAQRFRALPGPDRAALLSFLQSL